MRRTGLELKKALPAQTLPAAGASRLPSFAEWRCVSSYDGRESSCTRIGNQNTCERVNGGKRCRWNTKAAVDSKLTRAAALEGEDAEGGGGDENAEEDEDEDEDGDANADEDVDVDEDVDEAEYGATSSEDDAP